MSNKDHDSTLLSSAVVIDKPALNFSILTTRSTNQCKTLSIDRHGALNKESSANAYDGFFTVHSVQTIAEFETLLSKLTPKQSLILGTPHRKDGTALQVGEKISLTTKEHTTANAIPRSKDFIKFRHQAGFLLFDIDGGGTYEQLLEFIPELNGIAALIRPSSSSFIYNAEGRELSGARGWHIFIPVLNLTDAERIAVILWARMWLAGFGHYEISKGLHPALLERGIYDKSVLGACERLAFEAKPILKDGLVQRADEYTRIIEGSWFDTAMIQDLTADELEQIEKLKQAARETVRPNQQRAIKSAKRAYIEQSGKPAKAALSDFKLFAKRELPPDFVITTIQGIMQVGELDANHDGLTLCDPLEPDYDGGNKTKAKFFWNHGNNPLIYSQAHGGITYKILESEYTGKTSLENALRKLFDKDFSKKEISRIIGHAKQKLGLSGYAETAETKLSIYQYCQTERERQQRINNLTPSATPDHDTAEPNAQTPEDYPNTEQRPCYRVYDDWWLDCDGNHKPSGTYYHSYKETELGIALIDKRLCGVLRVIGLAYAPNHHAYGMILEFESRGSFRHKWNMPMTLLAGGASGDLIKELLEKGLHIENRCQTAVYEYINSQHPKKHVYTASQVGWFENKSLFVLPHESIGKDNDSVMYQSMSLNHAEYETQGSIAQWCDNIGALCVGNSLMMLFVSSAFAGALLKFSGMDGAGLHSIGHSSCGKTTVLKAACSVWGQHSKYKRTWKSTANGLEGACSLFNDGLLALDEISDCEPNELKQTIYALGNGTGKQRANAHGNAKKVSTWRVMVLSNGEKSIEAHLAEKGINTKAGQLIRLLQIPVFGQYGAFDDLHDFKDGATFANELNHRVNQYYGAVGRGYLEKLTRDTDTLNSLKQRLTNELENYKTRFDNLSEQELRAAKTFALIGVAGEVASSYGLTSWRQGMATQAALICFEQWRNYRGAGNTEHHQILDLVKNYLDTFGDARFTNVLDDTRLTGMRSGYYRNTEKNGREWLFTKAGLQEATKGYDLKQVIEVLKTAGWLMLDSQGKSTKTAIFKGNETGNNRFYILRTNTANTFENSGVSVTSPAISDTNTTNTANTSKMTGTTTNSFLKKIFSEQENLKQAVNEEWETF